MPISFESGLSILPNSPSHDGNAGDGSASDGAPESNLRQYTQFVRQHETSIFTYVLKYVGSREDAEDITQEALLQAYRTWSQVDAEVPGGYVKWCYRIARNLAIDLVRKKKPRAADDEEMER